MGIRVACQCVSITRAQKVGKQIHGNKTKHTSHTVTPATTAVWSQRRTLHPAEATDKATTKATKNTTKQAIDVNMEAMVKTAQAEAATKADRNDGDDPKLAFR
eukprot:symbB.v1.2.036384.t1/scaffold5112.1/size47538/3